MMSAEWSALWNWGFLISRFHPYGLGKSICGLVLTRLAMRLLCDSVWPVNNVRSSQKHFPVTSAVSWSGLYIISSSRHVCSLFGFPKCVSEDEQRLSAVEGSVERGMRSDCPWLTCTYAAVLCKTLAGKWSGRVVPLNPGCPLRKRLTALNVGLSLTGRKCWHKFLSD